MTTAVGDVLPELTIEATPTFVVSTALATRDFQDVHHDRDLAQQRGSKDIFVNILTDTGLVHASSPTGLVPAPSSSPSHSGSGCPGMPTTR